MKSKSDSNSDVRIKKATEILQKVWWFCFLMIVSPLAVGAIGFVISSSLFMAGTYVALAFAVLTYATAILVFYRAFDKYRNKPFFLNKENNLTARIHITYLISILSFITTPVFVLLARGSASFIILALISFSILYNIVYFYYYFQPIDFYSKVDEEFKHAIDLKHILKEPYNFILGINHFVHIIFLYFTYPTGYSWLFGLIANSILYLYTLMRTRNTAGKVKEAIRENRSHLQDLTNFKQKFVISMISLIFFLLIQLPFLLTIFSGAYLSNIEVLNSTFLTVIFILVYVKVRYYTKIYYNSIFRAFIDAERASESNELIQRNRIKTQKLNTWFSGVLIGFILAFSFLIQAPWMMFIVLPFFLLFSYFEQKADLCPKKYNRYIFLLNTTSILISISFGILASLLALQFRFLVFFILFYLLLQAFVKFEYFKKETILVVQNVLAVSIFSIIIYSFFPLIRTQYISFTTDPLLILIANICLHGILISLILMSSLFVLHFRRYSKEGSKPLRLMLSLNILLIEFFIYFMINLRVSFLTPVLMVSTLLFPLIFLFFIFVTHLMGIFARKNFMQLSYYIGWILTFNIFILLFYFFLSNLSILALDFLFLSIFSHINLSWGVKLEKVKDSSFKRFLKANSYFMTVELLVLFFFFFFDIILVNFSLLDKIVLSFYFSYLFMTLIANILSRKDIVFSSSIAVKINVISLIFSAGVAYYYSFMITFSTCYVFIIPFLCLFSILFFPLVYLLKMKLYEGFARKALMITSALLSLLLTLLPTIISLEISRLGFLVDFFAVINYSLLIFPSISLFFVAVNYFIGVFSKRRCLALGYFLIWIFIIDLVLIIFFISQANLVIISLNLLLLSVTSHFNLKFGQKLEKVKESTITQFVRINSYIMTLELSFLFFFLFYSYVLNHLVFYLNLVFSLYISLLLMVFIVNLLSKKEVVFSASITIKINVLALIYTAGLAFYYSLLYTFNSMYVFLVPFLCLVSILFFPTYYLFKIEIYKKTMSKLIIIEGFIIAGLIASIPTIVASNLLLTVGFELDRVSILNFTLYITFGLLVITQFLFKRFNIKDIYKLEVRKSQIFLLVIFAVTTVFYYMNKLLPGNFAKFLFPIMSASIFLYLPSVLSYKKRYFNENSLKKWIMAISLILSGSVILTPIVIGLEIAWLGLPIDLILISWSTLLLFFINLRYLIFISHRFKVLEKRTQVLVVIRILTWLLISLLVGFEVYIWLPKVVSLSTSLFITFILNIYTLKLLSDYSKEKRYINFMKEAIIYGIIFSLAFQVVTLLEFSSIFSYLPAVLRPFNLIWYLGSFFIIVFLFIKLVGAFSKFGFSKIKDIVELISWFTVKISISVLVSLFFLSSILTMSAVFFFMFAFLSPVTLTSLISLKKFTEKGRLILKRLILSMYIISLLVLYTNSFYSIPQIHFSFASGILYSTIIFGNCFLLIYYSLLRLNLIIRSESNGSIYQFYISSLVLCLSLLLVIFFPLYLSFLFIISLYLVLSRRTVIAVYKFLAYIFLSYSIFSSIALSLPNYGIFSLNFIAFYSQLYLLTLTIVFLVSIWMHRKKNNNLEKYSLYSILSFLSFLILSVYTNVLLLYNITIALSLFMFFMGIYFYRKKNVLYKWFIRPCVLLLIFNAISFISYSFLFNNPQYLKYSPILTFTFTLSLTGFGFVGLYNKAPANFRKKSFYFVLISIIISFPVFLYYLIIASVPALVGDVIPLIISINVGVILFYLSIIIYQWRISWAIWESGWYAWIAFPIVNFLIIYRSVRGIDVFTNSLKLFGTITIDGSIIITSIICVIFSLPFWYTWLKRNFYRSLFIVWGLSLFLIYWTTQNIFTGSQLLVNISFFFLAVVFLIPLLIKLKLWKLTSVIWLAMIVFNFSFLLFYLPTLGMSLGMAVSFDILAVGLLLMIYSFFPNIRSIGVILIIAYSTILLGVFLSIYYVLLAIILDPIFSLNLSFLVLGFSLFSSKYFKLPMRFVNLTLSWILIFNFAWLTYNTFSLFPGMQLFPIFLALTVFGCSFFIFNRYKMKFRINRMIPLFVVAIGTSLSVSSLVSILLNASPYILISISSAIFIVFLYFIFIEYRYFLWVLIPIPMILPILDQILLIRLFSSFWLLTLLSFLVLYVLFFQVLINIFKNSGKKEGDEPLNSVWKIFQDKNQVRLINFTSFFLNSAFISLFLAIMTPIMLNEIVFVDILIVYQSLDFIILWPISLLLCFKYIEKSELTIKIKDQLLQYKKISFLLYLLIPFASATNLLLFTEFKGIPLDFGIYSFLLLYSGIVFFEGIVVDRGVFHYLTKSLRNKLNFLSWFIFCSTVSVFLFRYHNDIFLLMCSMSSLHLISLYFLSKFDVSKQKIFTARIILLYNLFIWGSFYVGSMISRGIVIVFRQLSGIPPYLLLLQNTMLILYILSYIFVKFNKKPQVELILFVIFQVLLGINLLYSFNIYNILTVFTVILITLFETCLLFKTVHYINKIAFESRRPQLLPKIFSLLIAGLYLELSLLIYGVMIEFTGIFESILVSQLVFLLLTLFDIYGVKKIKRSYAYLIHTFSFFIISLMAVFIVHNFVSQFLFLLYIELLIFTLMQFYTNYSLSTSMKYFSPDKIESLNKWKKGINRGLGIVLYGTLFPLLLEVLQWLGLEFQLILLILSILSYVLMVFDSNSVKLLGKTSNYLKAISWMSVMIFIALYLVSIFNSFNLFNFFPIALIILLETCLLFQLVKYLNSLFFQEKHPQFLKLVFSFLVIVLYFEISVLIFALMTQFTGIYESILVSQVTLLILTILDIYSIKKIKTGYGQLIHTVSYFIISLMILLFLQGLIGKVQILLSFGILLFVTMQFYTNYSFFAALKQFSPDKVEIIQKRSSQMKRVLGTGFYITICFIVLQSLLLVGIVPQLIFSILSLIIHFIVIFDSRVLKFLGKGGVYLKVGTWVLFMASIGVLVFYIIGLFTVFNFFTLVAIIIIETILLFQFVKYIYDLFLKEKHPQVLTKAYSLLVIVLYLELSLLMYGLMVQFTSIIISILVSQVVLFALTIVDINSVKKIKKGYAQLIHTISYFVISCMIFLILHDATGLFPILLSVEFSLFIVLQFYTIYSFFTAMEQLYPNKKEILVKRRSVINRVLGASFYISLSFILLQSLIMFGVAPQSIFLSLSLMGHFLMLIDSYILKFLGKYANYLKVITWIFLMAFTAIYLIWLYLAYFLSYFSTSIPLIIFILVLEAVYLIKLLDFSKYILSKKQKIRSFLLFVLYLDFITWPLYFVTLNLLRSLNLVIFSFILLMIFTYIDEKVRVFPEKRLVPLRKAIFLIIGGLLSVDLFILLNYAPNTSVQLNLSVALLNLVLFLGIIVKPFKRHSLKAFVFWAVICLLISLILRDLSNSWNIFLAAIAISLFIYPFVFLLEELRELFNKLLDSLVRFFRKIKVAFINFSKAIYRFIKANFKIIWILFSIFLAVFTGILMSDIVLGLLNPGHTTLLMFAIVGLLSLLIPSEESEDADVIFKRRVLRLSIGWGSVISLLFILITPDWYPFAGFISTAVVGTIILVFIRRKEEREKISIRWRFFTLLSLFILLIILGILSLIVFIGSSP